MECTRICPLCGFQVDKSFGGRAVAEGTVAPIATDKATGTGWQTSSTLWISRGQFELTIQFAAYSESPGYTNQIVTAETYSSNVEEKEFEFWYRVGAAGVLYRIIMLFGEAVSARLFGSAGSYILSVPVFLLTTFFSLLLTFCQYHMPTGYR